MTGIYKIQSTIKPERYYIGSAVDINKRWKYHLSRLKNKKHHCPKLQRHCNKYGINDLKFIFLIGCSKEDLLSTEQFFLDSYNTYFNTCKIAGSVMTNRRHTPETIEKLRKYNTGRKRPHNPEWNKNISIGKTGKKRICASEETKQKMRNSHNKRWLENPVTQEFRDKMSTILIGNKHSSGHVPSTEVREKISNSLKKYYLSRPKRK